MTRDAWRKRRILLVGEDFGRALPRYRSDRYALTGQSGERIAALAGLEFPAAYARVFDRMNLVALPAEWSDSDAVARGVERVTAMIAERERVVLLGRRVAAALDALDMSLLEWKSWRVRVDGAIVSSSVEVARFPHPSGRNRWWNEPANIELARSFLKDVLRWAKS